MGELSYYAPTGEGTVNITEGPTGDEITVTGEPINVFVTCDLERRVYCISGLSANWYRDLPGSWPRGAASFEGLVYFSDGNHLVAVNPRTSYEHFRRDLGGIINSFNIRQDKGATYLTVCFSRDDVGSVSIYRFDGANIYLHYTNPYSAAHPRGAYYLDGWLFVSDTFGHDVYAVDIQSSVKRVSKAVFYPNTIEPITSSKVRICAEHENRILIWDYVANTTEIEHSAPIEPFNNPGKNSTDIISEQSLTAADAPSPPKSMCAKEFSGELTLYSPNSAYRYGDDLLIADTDNHRVMMIRGGEVVTEITGFNNPVNAVLW